MAFVGTTKTIRFYSGAIVCAGSFTGDKDVTISAVVVNKSLIIPARGPTAAQTAAGFYPPTIATTDGNLYWDYIDVATTTLVRFHNVVNTAGIAHNISYAFWVVEYR